MTAQQTPSETAPHAPLSERRDDAVTLGVILLAVGGLTLVGRIAGSLDLGLAVLPLVGAALMAVAWLRRQSGFAVAGGIVLGIGVGAWLIEGPFARLGGDAEGGVFLLAFAAGWALVSAVSGAIERRRVLWPLIPAGVLALLGIGLLGVGGILEAFALLGTVWPLMLIAGGVWLLWAARGERR